MNTFYPQKNILQTYPLLLVFTLYQLLFFHTYTWADKDTQLRLQQRDTLNNQQQEKKILKEELEKESSPHQLTINGHNYSIKNNVNDLGQALYLCLQQRQWHAAHQYLQRYRALPNHDLMLVHYAQGALARIQGSLTSAEQQYRALLTLQADFLPGQLELARVLFENHKNQQAIDLFHQIKKTIPSDKVTARGVRNTVNHFIQALKHRNAWQSSIAIGPRYTDNINHSSESYTCFLRFSNGQCLIERSVPKAESASGADFDVSINKRFSLKHHHGISFDMLMYGNTYKNYSNFNENTAISKLGYSYHSAKNHYLIAPVFEYRSLGDNTLYSARGGHLQWMHIVSGNTAFKLETDYKDLEYKQATYAFETGALSSTYATFWHRLPKQWLVFGGLDYVEKHNANKVHAHRLTGIRLGISKTVLPGIEATLFSSYRQRKYGAYSALLGAQREDNEQNHTLIISAPRFKLFDITPTINYEYNRVNSNVDWLYSYEKNSISLKFEKQF